MIKELTKEQELKMKEFAEKWTKVGLSTSPTNKARAEKAICDAYEIAGLEKPKMIFWADSPLALPMTLKLIRELSKEGFKPYSEMKIDNVRANVWTNVEDKVWANVGANVMANVRDNVGANVGVNVRANVEDKVWANVGANVMANVRDNVRANVEDKVWANVGANVEDKVWANVGANVWTNVSDNFKSEWSEYKFWGQYDSSWLSYYDYFSKVLNLEFCEKLRPLMNLAEETSLSYFFKDIAILGEKPIEINLNNDGRLHNPKGACIKWKDGYEIHALNGIVMPKELVLLKPEEITKEIILKQENADYRRELVRKLSGEQLVKVLSPKVLDKKFGYELLAIDLGDNRIRPFLKMQNPSIDAIHIEGVSPECRTVEDAIKFRNGLEEFSLPKTLDGFSLFTEFTGEYHAQGDCLFFPETMPSKAVKCNHNIAGDGLIRHMINNGEVFELNGTRYLLAFENCEITHPEHKSTFLQEGVSYRVGKVLEYDHWKEEARVIID